MTNGLTLHLAPRDVWHGRQYIRIFLFVPLTAGQLTTENDHSLLPVLNQACVPSLVDINCY